MKISELEARYKKMTKGTFNDLQTFNFKGVYIICDNQEIVYIGSAYSRYVSTRLKQYISETDTGNTLGRNNAKELAGVKIYTPKAEKQIVQAIEKIKKFNIYAIKSNDLEYKLIEEISPKYNNRGKKAN